MQASDLRKAGLKVTVPRSAVLRVLELGEPRHFSAEDIFRHLSDANEDIGLATVYRVLAQFVAAGIVSRRHFGTTKAMYELNEGKHHDHIVCVDCGKVEEFTDSQIESRQRQIAEARGCALREHSMTLYGHCQKPDCENRARAGDKWSR